MGPVIVVVVDDDQTREELSTLLNRRFGPDYRTVAVRSGDAISVLAELAGSGEQVAVAVAASRLATANGVDLLGRARRLHPNARRVLLVERGQWQTDHPVRQAIVLGLVDSYLFVPWGSREQWLYQPMSEYLASWTSTQPPEYEAVRIVGRQWEARAHAVRDLLSRAGVPFGFYEADSDEGGGVLAEVGADASRLPVLVFHSGTVFVRPSDAQVMEALGFAGDGGDLRCDVAIVGGGPGGLSAAVYASSEGLRTVLVDPDIPGGQAGTSSMIRNYLGFPRGVSGGELTGRAVEQAWLFGTQMRTGERAVRLELDGDHRIVHLDGGARIVADAVVIATGVSWRRLEVPGVEALVGAGVFYGAAAAEAEALTGQAVFVVGGGNSAGQAAVHLAKYAAAVTILIRRDALEQTMSDYLIREIAATPAITLRPETEIIDAHGTDRLSALTLRHRRTGERDTVPAAAAFIMIGGEPRTDWLEGTLARDRHGFLLTGGDLPGPAQSRQARRFLETSAAGVFAVGDVRHGSVKRVAPSVGSGAIAVQLIHQYLADR